MLGAQEHHMVHRTHAYRDLFGKPAHPCGNPHHPVQHDQDQGEARTQTPTHMHRHMDRYSQTLGNMHTRTEIVSVCVFQDKYLHTNCLAALANMSAQFRCLHQYAAQRIIR